ncbi:MAG TPA: helix-turn-helix domain-containing protein [Candidatus Nanoarchaeia archaeon]|nr:helix-turn-helix domain-containing protein [Candidatus Nanoarchaeia archaeon]
MNIEVLKKIGLSHTEASLYLRLLKNGASDVKTLVESTGFYKANTYDALERLCEKGLISKIVEGGKRIYQIQKPESFIEFIEKKKHELEEQSKIAKELAKNVENMKKIITNVETASVFRGISGVKQIYSEIINEKLDYFVFGSPKESDELIGDYYWQNLHLKQREHQIKAKAIFHKSLRNWKDKIDPNIISLRFFDEKFEPLTETTIYGSKVAFVIWLDIPVVTIINNSHLAESYGQVFNMLWKIAKK